MAKYLLIQSSFSLRKAASSPRLEGPQLDIEHQRIHELEFRANGTDMSNILFIRIKMVCI